MTVTYTEKDGGRTVYTAMRRGLKVSSTLLRKLKAVDAINVNGESAFTNRVLEKGDVLTLDLSAAEPESGLVPEEGELDVLWESEGLVAVNKPCGMLVHPTHSKYTGTLANIVENYIENGTAHAVNRLDRDTSGVVLFAKCSYWKDLAVHALADSGNKEYIAVVCGCPQPETGVIDMPIKRLSETDMMRVVSPDGQRAVTHYKTLFSGEDFSVVSLRLETGRTHQIRVHMSYIGCPLLGDRLYKTDKSELISERLGVCAQALHAVRLSFDEPLADRRVEIKAEVKREDLKNFLKNMPIGY